MQEYRGNGYGLWEYRAGRENRNVMMLTNCIRCRRSYFVWNRNRHIARDETESTGRKQCRNGTKTHTQPHADLYKQRQQSEDAEQNAVDQQRRVQWSWQPSVAGLCSGKSVDAGQNFTCTMPHLVLELNSKQTHSQAASIFIYKDRPDGTVKKGRPCSITERRVPELIPVLGSQPAGVVSH